jgi:hypothetical protein
MFVSRCSQDVARLHSQLGRGARRQTNAQMEDVLSSHGETRLRYAYLLDTCQVSRKAQVAHNCIHMEATYDAGCLRPGSLEVGHSIDRA